MSRLFALIVVALVAGTGTALADNTNCSGAVFVVPDGSLHQGVFTAPGQLRWFRFVAKADRSYAIAIENLSPTDLQPFVEFSEDNARLGTCAGPEPNTRFTETADPASRGLSGVVGSARATYVSDTTTDFFFAISTGVVGQSYRVRVEETTLFSPFFTTRGPIETYYRLANTTDAPVAFTLTLVDDAGTIVATHAATLPPNGTAPLISTGPPVAGVVGLGVPDDTTGQAIIVHWGPPGAIAADGYWSGSPGKGGVAGFAVPIAIGPARQQR
jgi:hypothetical protein